MSERNYEPPPEPPSAAVAYEWARSLASLSPAHEVLGLTPPAGRGRVLEMLLDYWGFFRVDRKDFPALGMESEGQSAGIILPLSCGRLPGLYCIPPPPFSAADVCALLMVGDARARFYPPPAECGAVGALAPDERGDLNLTADPLLWLRRWAMAAAALSPSGFFGFPAGDIETLILRAGAFEWRRGFADCALSMEVKRIVVRGGGALAGEIETCQRRPRPPAAPVVIARPRDGATV